MAVNSMVGNDIVMHVQTGGTPEAPVFSPVGFQRGLSDEATREIIDASHKNSDHAESVYGRMSGTASLEALEPNPEVGAQATHDALREAMNEKKTVLIQKVKGSAGGNKVLQAEALIGTISSEAPDNDVATISLEFTLQEAFYEPPASP